jgi:ABC-2 type transport system ATP-binding protein
MLGLDRFERGSTTFDGKQYHELHKPLFQVGALLDAGYVHPGRSGRNHLRWIAASNGIGASRVAEVLELVGMTAVAGRKVRGYSLGMRQRLGLAGVLLGDPRIVILDEPANGLDPEGVRWIRDVLVALARDGRTVLVSSHLLSEISLMADDLVVIGRGKLIEQGPVEHFIDRYAQRWVRVRTPRPAAFADVLSRAGAQIRPHGHDGIDVQGLPIERVGEIALQTQTVLHELSPQSESLEDAFLSATADVQEYRSGGLVAAPAPPASSMPPPPPPPDARPAGGES